MIIGCSCDLFCYVFLQQVFNQTGFHPFCPMNQVQSLNKKRASCERHKKLSRVVCTVHLHRLRSPGVGRNSAEGHLPYALRVRPQTKAHQMQAGQPARQPDPPQSGGGEQRRRGGWCVCRRVFVWFLLNEETVAVNLWINLWTWFCDDLIEIHTEV